MRLMIIGLVTMIVLTILFPKMAVGILEARVDPRARHSPTDILPAPIVALLVFSVLMFNLLSLRWGRVQLADPFDRDVAVFTALFLVVCGGLACFRPLRFIGLAAPRLRRVEMGDLSQRSLVRIELTSRMFGVIFLLAAAFMLQQFGSLVGGHAN